jgi:hypothetical protein
MGENGSAVSQSLQRPREIAIETKDQKE